MATRQSRPSNPLRRRIALFVLAVALGGSAVGYAVAQSSITLSAPVSFPVDI